jgi:hypothetical protein
VLQPIAKVAMPAAAQGSVSFDAFFTHILMHELMHGLGPHNITAAAARPTVRKEFKELYSTIEEAKADVSGLFAAPLPLRQGKARRQARRHDVHDLPGVDVPLDPRSESTRRTARRRDAVELLPRPRRRRASTRTARSR